MVNVNDSYDFGEMSGDDAEAGGGCPVGWYYCAVARVEPDQRFADKLRIEYTVLRGPHRGARIWESLFTTGMESNDPDVKERDGWRRKLGLRALRLGLWDGDRAHASRAWVEAVGVECVVETKTRTYPDGKTGEAKSVVEPAFAGVYPPDHPKIPDDVRKRLQLPAARQEAAHPGALSNGAKAPQAPPAKPAAKRDVRRI